MSQMTPEQIRRADRRAGVLCALSMLVLLGCTVVGALVGAGVIPFEVTP